MAATKKAKSKAKSKPSRKAKAKAPEKSKAPKKAKATNKASSKSAGKATKKENVASKLESGIAKKAVKAAEGTPLGPGVNAVLAGRAALAGTQAAGRAASVAASKVKVPLVAGGGMVVGIAGGLAVVRRRKAHAAQSSLDLDRVIGAARRAGSFGEELSRMASLMEQASSGSKRK